MRYPWRFGISLDASFHSAQAAAAIAATDPPTEVPSSTTTAGPAT